MGCLRTGPLSSRWLFNTGTIIRLLPRILVKYPDLFAVTHQGEDDDVFIALR